MSEEIKNSTTASSSHIIGTISDEGGQQKLTVEFSTKAIANETLKTSFSSAFITPLNNLFSHFATVSEDYPTLIRSGDMQENNRSRTDILDYTNIDGLDYSTSPNKNSYYKQYSIDYNIIPTIGQDNDLTDEDLVSRNYVYSDEIRTVGFKAPMFLAGWGIDCAGRPSPSVYDEQRNNEKENGYDNEFVSDYETSNPGRTKGEIDYLENSNTSGDIFELEKKKNTYMEGYASNPSNWNAGPVDLRWDRYRGVWAGSPVIVEGYLIGDLSAPSGRATNLKYTSGEIVLYTGQYDDWDIIQPVQKVWAINRSVGFTAKSGSYIACQFFPNGEFRPIWVDCSIDPSGAINKEGIHNG